MFTIAPVAAPVAGIGVLCMVLIAPYILRRKDSAGEGEASSTPAAPPKRRVPHFSVVFRVVDGAYTPLGCWFCVSTPTHCCRGRA